MKEGPTTMHLKLEFAALGLGMLAPYEMPCGRWCIG